MILAVNTLLVILLTAFSSGNATTNDDNLARNELEPRVIGGEVAAIGEFPYVVFVQSPKPKEQPGLLNISSTIKPPPYEKAAKSHCTGTIIDKLWVLTAAHCFLIESGKTDKVIIVAGTTSVIKFHKEHQRRYSTEFVVHPQYIKEDGLNVHDIALVKVGKPFDFSGCCVKPSRLWTVKFPAGEKVACTAVGFGRTSNSPDDSPKILHKIQLYPRTMMDCVKYPRPNFDKMFCVKHIPGKGICQGDSGGPFVCRGLIMGVASMNVNPDRKTDKDPFCATPRGISIYVFPKEYIPWLQQYVPVMQRKAVAANSAGSFLRAALTGTSTAAILAILLSHLLRS